VSELWLTWRRLAAGEGIGRILMDLGIQRNVKLAGTVLDVGGKGNHSYRRVIDESQVDLYCVIDLVPDETVHLNGSIVSLPVASSSCDAVLCFNVLEHVFEHGLALREIQRVLKRNGRIYGRVPFLMNVHADPCDYWRFTRWTLERLLVEAGFSDVLVTSDGGLFLTILNLMGPVWRRLGFLRFALAPLFLLLNRLSARVLGDCVSRETYPLGYFFTAVATGSGSSA